MVTKTVAIYVFFDDLLKTMDHKEPHTRKTTDSEIMTALMISTLYFGGNIEKAISFVRSTNLMPNMLSKSRFNRRMHAIAELIVMLFSQIGQALKHLTINTIYIINSFSVSVCHNIRINRSRLLKGRQYRGYNASKRCYFYGFKVHVIVTAEGIPVEYSFTAGSVHDLDGMKQMPLLLPEGSSLLADSAYTDYTLEEMLTDNQIRLLADRKQNSKHPHQPWINYLITNGRKRIETTFSDIVKLMPNRIHAVTEKGFLIKLIAFIFGFTIDKIISV